MTLQVNGRSARQIWETALGELQLQVNRSNYATYLQETSATGFDGATFTVAAPNGFARDWLAGRLASTVKKTLIGILGHSVDLRFVVHSEDPLRHSNGQSLTPLEQWGAGERPDLQLPRLTRLQPRYTFDSFVVGAGNRLAHAAAEAVASSPGTVYNPLFIYGGVGLGKTHLLHAIGHAGIQAGLRVLYVSSEQFTNEFIQAVREKANDRFRDKFRGADILLIDDIQFIATKEQTQEEFFHTFNDLHRLEKQIVLTSDRPPKSMPSLEDRLRSRFEWGLLADVQPPDFETRVAILETKARALNVTVPAEVLEMIAHNAQHNIRELEGSLNKILVYSRCYALPITTETAHHALLDTPGNFTRQSVSMQHVIDVVAGHYGISQEEIRGKKRNREIAQPRHIAMYLCRELTQESLGEIGREFAKDRTTVMHGCDKIDSDAKEDQRLAKEISELKTMLYRR